MKIGALSIGFIHKKNVYTVYLCVAPVHYFEMNVPDSQIHGLPSNLPESHAVFERLSHHVSQSFVEGQILGKLNGPDLKFDQKFTELHNY